MLGASVCLEKACELCSPRPGRARGAVGEGTGQRQEAHRRCPSPGTLTEEDNKRGGGGGPLGKPQKEQLGWKGRQPSSGPSALPPRPAPAGGHCPPAGRQPVTGGMASLSSWPRSPLGHHPHSCPPSLNVTTWADHCLRGEDWQPDLNNGHPRPAPREWPLACPRWLQVIPDGGSPGGGDPALPTPGARDRDAAPGLRGSSLQKGPRGPKRGVLWLPAAKKTLGSPAPEPYLLWLPAELGSLTAAFEGHPRVTRLHACSQGSGEHPQVAVGTVLDIPHSADETSGTRRWRASLSSRGHYGLHTELGPGCHPDPQGLYHPLALRVLGCGAVAGGP